MNILAELRRRFAAALVAVTGDAADASLAEMVLPSQDARFGEYQANCAMPLGKRLGKPPRDIAAALVEQLDMADLCENPAVAGPGFINLRLRDEYLSRALQQIARDADRLGVRSAETPRTYVLDYSGPNVAKPMHVGHIRSTVIGDALCRVLRFLGHRVISDNHIGDWGTQFGMIIYGWKHFGDETAFQRAPVPELTRLYKLVNQLVDYHTAKCETLPALEQRLAEQESAIAQLKASGQATANPGEKKKFDKRVDQLAGQLAGLRQQYSDLQAAVAVVEADPRLKQLADKHPQIGAAVLAETAALHAGDAVNRALWERFLPPCLAEINQTYERLGVSFDHTLGESFYEDALPGVVADLTAQGLARESNGAMCVFLEGHETPFLVQKKDGAFLYATTDLATIQYRMNTWRADAILYVVDHRQSLHFEQLFATARLWGYDNVELQHLSFGTVLGDDGRPFKTRSGASVGLMDLLDEAVERAHAIAVESDALSTESERRQVAERIGIGAIKYADLAHNRTSDYKFSYDKMLAMTGNTAAYMQYSYARVKGIFDKGDVDPSRLRCGDAAVVLGHAAERSLAVALVQFNEALDRVVADYRPNHLTDYLFDVASKYATFFENCPVLRAESEALRASRLILCDLTALTLSRGLSLLGIATVERM